VAMPVHVAERTNRFASFMPLIVEGLKSMDIIGFLPWLR